MAQSRPPPPPSSRAVTSPPLSPTATTPSDKSSRHGTKHSKSKGETPLKAKSTKPATLNRKSTPQHMARTGSSQSSKGTSGRERERGERKEEEEEGETFLQFCSFCEKQIDGGNGAFLYCSESCRARDLSSPSHTRSSRHSYFPSPPTSPTFTRSLSTYYPATDGPDIVPRASPTLSRPRSYFNSDPFPLVPSSNSMASSLPYHQSPYYSASSSQYNNSSSNHRASRSGASSKHGSSTALASLRELSAALETSKTNSSRYERDRSGSSDDDDSVPASPSGGAWSYNPFSNSSTSLSNSNFTPKQIARSYTQPPAAGYSYNTGPRYGSGSGASSSTYGAGTGVVYGTGLARTPGAGMDRPLPPRSVGFGHRPRSMDLVTPFSGSLNGSLMDARLQPRFGNDMG